MTALTFVRYVATSRCRVAFCVAMAATALLTLAPSSARAQATTKRDERCCRTDGTVVFFGGAASGAGHTGI